MGVLVLLPQSSGLWQNHLSFPFLCSLHHHYYFSLLNLCPTPPFGSSSIQGVRSLTQAGFPFVDSLIGFSEGFLESQAILQATPTRSRIFAFLRYLLGHITQVRRLLYLFRAIDLRFYAVNSLSCPHSCLLNFMYFLKRGQDEVEQMLNCCLKTSEQDYLDMEISLIHSAICVFALGVLCFN